MSYKLINWLIKWVEFKMQKLWAKLKLGVKLWTWNQTLYFDYILVIATNKTRETNVRAEQKAANISTVTVTY